MVTVHILVLHLVDICSLVQKKQFVAGRSRFVAGRKYDKRDDSRPGPQTMSKEDISEKNLKWPDILMTQGHFWSKRIGPDHYGMTNKTGNQARIRGHSAH